VLYAQQLISTLENQADEVHAPLISVPRRLQVKPVHPGGELALEEGHDVMGGEKESRSHPLHGVLRPSMACGTPA
jgi:hypothetical protein